MSLVLRIISGAAGLTILVGTVVLALNLISMGHDVRVYLAAYMGIGGILIGAYLLFYAIYGDWRPNQASRKKRR
ncbi:MAG: hypothetical protein KJP16_07945 [Gammaproteobacteria bacterium]|nr:hypothetical protein [Gammaproteobacteria bacterium]NNC57131.1 hypothetical protein [Woeseiaceae bacterium]NNL50734.1 hypothetical protein [Woeseiaceae bacterium]